MARGFMERPKRKCPYCEELLADGKYYRHIDYDCEERKKLLEKVLEDMGELPF